MTDPLAAFRNLGFKALRRLGSAHKPLVRLSRKRARAQEQRAFERQARDVEREIAAIASGSAPIVAGPWLAEVGYEALYWVPFLRWFCDAHRVRPERVTVLSRGGVREWYRGIAGSYVDIFDALAPSELATRNQARMDAEEGGGRKQSTVGGLDAEILARTGVDRAADVLHPSLMFRLFRNVWHGNLPFDLLWTRTDYALIAPPALPQLPNLPSEFVTVKFYSGTTLPASREHRDAVRDLVARVAGRMPVVVLDTGLAVDDHDDFTFPDMPQVISARNWMRPADNLGLQTALIARSRMFLGTCGGLAWLAPFLGVPTVAVYADDRQLAPHLFVARQAGRRVGAADFLPLDLRALARVGAVSLL
jgi:hypothetical protein